MGLENKTTYQMIEDELNYQWEEFYKPGGMNREHFATCIINHAVKIFEKEGYSKKAILTLVDSQLTGMTRQH